MSNTFLVRFRFYRFRKRRLGQSICHSSEHLGNLTGGLNYCGMMAYRFKILLKKSYIMNFYKTNTINLMNAKALLFMAALLVMACSNDNDKKEKTTEPFEEVPPGIVQSKPCTTLYKGIMDMFVEHNNNSDMYTQLFAASAEKRIVLTRDSEVYVTFISEGAGWPNTFGWYSYNAENPPGSPSDIEKNVLFPHVSDEVLSQGDMLQVGTGPFKAGTVIGFFLIARGWEEGVVNYRKSTLYTDTRFNSNQFQQHILFKEGDCGDIVIGFEDRWRDLSDCDFDYNDIIMTIADNKEQLETTAFDLTNFIVM